MRGETLGLHPRMLDALAELDRRCDFIGLELVVVSGLRSVDEQNRLYSIGRTLPEIRQHVYKRGQGGAVTDAAGGESPHNWGLAVDVSEGNGHNDALMAIARAMGFGLVSWDAYHLEWPNWRAMKDKL